MASENNANAKPDLEESIGAESETHEDNELNSLTTALASFAKTFSQPLNKRQRIGHHLRIHKNIAESAEEESQNIVKILKTLVLKINEFETKLKTHNEQLSDTIHIVNLLEQKDDSRCLVEANSRDQGSFSLLEI